MSIKALKDISYPLTIVYFRNLGVFLVVGAMIFEIERLSGLHSCFGREAFPRQNFFSTLLAGIVFTCLFMYLLDN